MPIHDVGYRSWKGRLTATWTRWWTISELGIRNAFSSRWIRRIVLASWFPVIYFGAIFFAFENLMLASFDDLNRQIGGQRLIDGDLVRGFEESDLGQQKKYELQKQAITNNGMVSRLPNGDALVESIESGDESMMRNTVWSYLLSSFLRYSQGLMTLMIVGLIVPPLISRDVRSRAFLLYYSRPITRMEYLLGKISIPAFVLLMVTLVPGIALYAFGLMLSPNLSVIFDTWDLPFRIVVATAVCLVPTCLIGLLFSSLTQESRFAGFAWFTVWGLGAVVWMGIYMSNSEGGTIPFDSNWSLISIYSTIGRVQSWVFGLENDLSRVIPSAVALTAISVFSFILLYRRISAPIRV